jgi:hypothetical protein
MCAGNFASFDNAVKPTTALSANTETLAPRCFSFPADTAQERQRLLIKLDAAEKGESGEISRQYPRI